MLEKSFVEERKNPKASLKELIKKKDYKALSEHLEQGIEDYLNGDVFKRYLEFISKFHKYSHKNARLILEQNQKATYVASYGTWKKMERQVKKKSKALYVYAPRFKDKKDSEGNLVTNEHGEIQKDVYYVLVPVFDVSQTDGEKELPRQIYNLSEELDDSKKFAQTYKALEEISPAKITIEPIVDRANGYFVPSENRIVVRQGLGEVMTIKVLIHEITHALLHTNSTAVFGDEIYRRQEFEAESVAYIVTNHLGIDCSDYSFGYLSSWTDRGNDLQSLTDSLQVITNQAKDLIEQIDQMIDKVYTLDAPRNKFEERVAIARNQIPEPPRTPPKQYEVQDPKVRRPTKTL